VVETNRRSFDGGAKTATPLRMTNREQVRPASTQDDKS
jgi:hypothetical protein